MPPAVHQSLHAMLQKGAVAQVADLPAQSGAVIQMVAPCRKVTFKEFSHGVAHASPQILARGIRDYPGIDKAMSCRLVVKVKAVKISVLPVHNGQGCGGRTGGCNRREGEDRKARPLCSALGRVQRLSLRPCQRSYQPPAPFARCAQRSMVR